MSLCCLVGYIVSVPVCSNITGDTAVRFDADSRRGLLRTSIQSVNRMTCQKPWPGIVSQCQREQFHVLLQWLIFGHPWIRKAVIRYKHMEPSKRKYTCSIARKQETIRLASRYTMQQRPISFHSVFLCTGTGGKSRSEFIPMFPGLSKCISQSPGKGIIYHAEESYSQ